MTWFKVDDGLHSHRKAVRAGIPAMGLWVMAGSWCADQLTDGWLPDYIAMRLDADYEQHARTLVQVGLWVEEIRDGEPGWRFHEWDEPGRQPTREQVLADRAANAERQKRARERAKEKREAESRVQSQRESRNRNAVTTAVTNGVSHGAVTGAVTVPPTRPDPTRTSFGSIDSSPGAEDAQPTIEGMPEAIPAQNRRTTKAAPAKASPPGEETQGQRVNRVTRTYTDVVKLADYMGVQQVTKTALTCGDYTEDQVVRGLEALATKRDPVTRNSLRIAIEGLSSWAQSNEQPPQNGGMRGYQRGKHQTFKNPTSDDAYEGTL